MCNTWRTDSRSVCQPSRLWSVSTLWSLKRQALKSQYLIHEPSPGCWRNLICLYQVTHWTQARVCTFTYCEVMGMEQGRWDRHIYRYRFRVDAKLYKTFPHITRKPLSICTALVNEWTKGWVRWTSEMWWGSSEVLTLSVSLSQMHEPIRGP